MQAMPHGSMQDGGGTPSALAQAKTIMLACLNSGQKISRRQSPLAALKTLTLDLHLPRTPVCRVTKSSGPSPLPGMPGEQAQSQQCSAPSP